MRVSKSTKVKIALLVVGGAFQFIESCDDRLLTITRFVDPCGTILANCQPGDFQIFGAGLNNPCIDPTCTVPGGCDQDGPPLGVTNRLCD